MDVSLLGGWFPSLLGVLAVGLLVLAIGRRDRRWRRRVLPIALGVAAAGALLASYPGAELVGMTDPLPLKVWIWFGIGLAGVTVLVAGWRSARWWRRGTAVLAIVVASVVCANQINQFVGYYPTIDAAVNDWTGAPLPGQVSMTGLAQTPTGQALPRAGRLVAVDVPPTYSGFKHRQELVYLPPVWFRGPKHPVLPVVEMIGGERGAPGDWVRLGNAVRVSDAYAQQHHGFAPILVFVDATASFDNDTECVDGPRGHAATHLAVDVPQYVEHTFGASRNPAQWAVAGFSMGGTCALDLVVEHPGTFGHFVDISGDLAPYSGDAQDTLRDLYGGSVAAEQANEPLQVMRHHGRYQGVSGVFLTSTAEKTHQREAHQLSKAAAKVGIPSRVEVSPGSHVWQFAGPAFAGSYPWLVDQLRPA
ncbi:esterase family protein [Kribbella sandramycini]|uniref:Esterase family protein n=1 Tax=Kribbella sandramycini TaxID=60450 RepID=A0A7Y4KXR5_9ACTN|nr:alpha/beta hydrolase-fold protein [Kribbella sandramycini]MBB6569578.1 S-formylglutathione hydrolase FrmB [Kribbella sandramycini]NOL40588.1 esterase family protein [Kribbella sandramycini]